MKDFLKEYIRIIISILCAIILCLGFYNLFINFMHQSYIDEQIAVSDLDKNYSKYKDNINNIKNNIRNYNYNSGINYEYDMETMEKLRGKINSCLTLLNGENGVSALKAGQYLKPFDLYELNVNFLETLINQCWISNLGYINLNEHNYDGYFKEVFPRYNKTVEILIDNSNYVKNELINNSSYHYSTDVFKNNVRNEFLAQYNMVISNYKNFSDIILEISNFVAKGEY